MKERRQLSLCLERSGGFLYAYSYFYPGDTNLTEMTEADIILILQKALVSAKVKIIEETGKVKR